MTCPSLRLEDGAGLADTLKSIDCRTGEATASAFDRLFGSHGALLPALTILLTLYVAIFAIGLLTGRARVGVSALTPRMLTLGLALTFATSWMAYSQVVWSLAVGAPDQVATLLSGTKGSATAAFADRLDTIFSAIADSAGQQQATAPVAPATPGQAPVPVPNQGFFTPNNMLWLSGLLLLVGTVGVLVTAKIALAALLGLGPVFIVLALFKGTRGLFEGWLKAVVSFAMVPMFAVLIGGGTIALITPLIRAALMDGGEAATRSTIALFLAAVVYCALMVMVVRTTKMIVSGWRLPFGREPLPAASSTASATVSAPAPAMLAAGAGGPAAMDERIRAVVAALPPAANDAAAASAGGGGGRGVDRRIVTEVATGVASTPASATDARLGGVGSRFRAPPQLPNRTRLS